MSEPLYWEIAHLSYQDTIKLQAGDLFEHYTRDPVSSSVKFWPPSKGVLNYLRANLPEGASIVNEGTQAATKEASRIKKPIIIHRMGQDIDND